MKIEVKKNILARNDTAAAENRERLSQEGVCMINLMASPGAGKTSVIMKAIESLSDRYAMAVIEGDIASEIDSLAIEAVNIPALQINTGGSCHLTASMISSALDHLDLDSLDLVIVENVGNLVCPAEFDLGETGRVMIASITEGHDKPHKYPAIFKKVDAILVNKIDLLPYCDFDMSNFHDVVEGLNPDGAIIELSCKDGYGTDEWCNWMEAAISECKTRLSS